MTIQEIQKRVDEIARFTKAASGAHASEVAVEMEDNLRTDFIAHVRDDPNDPELRAKAMLVLSVKDIFDRWYP
jgi:hypothetical protein